MTATSPASTVRVILREADGPLEVCLTPAEARDLEFIVSLEARGRPALGIRTGRNLESVALVVQDDRYHHRRYRPTELGRRVARELERRRSRLPEQNWITMQARTLEPDRIRDAQRRR